MNPSSPAPSGPLTMDKGGGEKRQSGLTLTPIMWAYVEACRATGLYGDSTSSVLRELILCSLRRALESHIIEKVKQ